MKLHVFATIGLCLAFAACRGGISHKPPIHLVPDMDDQQKIEAQSEFEFEGWKDKRGMRPPVEGTVPHGSGYLGRRGYSDKRGFLESVELEKYQNAAGDFIANKVPLTRDNLLRGQNRYNIYCAVCHDRAGSGKGMVLQRAPRGSFNAKVPDLSTEPRLLKDKMRDGELFQTITEGKATMPAYGHAISVEDRWCIVHYLRALQHRIKP